ncbi:MAG: PIN domain-containing protein [Betaproteobacteria bacterium]|nr:PIN domain-containing protein [Betaproteobacteria bacterium]
MIPPGRSKGERRSAQHEGSPESHLLDANALIALCWPTHEHHPRVLAWFRQHARKGWATTALTQAAFVRIVSQQAFAGRSVSIGEVAELLLRNTAHTAHRFVPLDFAFDQVLVACTGGVLGHRQVTDAWLLTAAMRNGMKLLTFDTGIGQLLATSDERDRHLAILRAEPAAVGRS